MLIQLLEYFRFKFVVVLCLVAFNYKLQQTFGSFVEDLYLVANHGVQHISNLIETKVSDPRHLYLYFIWLSRIKGLQLAFHIKLCIIKW